jgi:hypothetical protein
MHAAPEKWGLAGFSGMPMLDWDWVVSMQESRD